MSNPAEEKHGIEPIESLIAAAETGALRHQTSRRFNRAAM
jgi:hypothetical protein